MKIAKIQKLYLSLNPGTSMDNYRPIYLWSCFSKILEKIVYTCLTNFFESNNIISKSQFGIRVGHSTVHPMVKFMNFVSNALNKKQHSIAIFCDLRKAFDTCNHQILFLKNEKNWNLWDHFGVVQKLSIQS